MIRLYFKDGTYMDVERRHVWEYEADPAWSHSEMLTTPSPEEEWEDMTLTSKGLTMRWRHVL